MRNARLGPDGLGRSTRIVRLCVCVRAERTMRNAMGRLFRDDAGGEVIEYALILGLIIVTAIVIIGTVGTKVLARWTSVNSSM